VRKKQERIPPEYLEKERHNFWNPHNFAIGRMYVSADGATAYYGVYWSSTADNDGMPNMGDPNNQEITSYIRESIVNPDGSFDDQGVPLDANGADINRVGINLLTDLTADGTLYMAFMAGNDQYFFNHGEGGTWQFTFQLSYQFLETVTNQAGDHSWIGEIDAVVPQ
jgi:hypothetical protein